MRIVSCAVAAHSGRKLSGQEHTSRSFPSFDADCYQGEVELITDGDLSILGGNRRTHLLTFRLAMFEGER